MDKSENLETLEIELREGLPRLEREEAFDRLIDVLREHPSASVREAAAYGLTWSFDQRAVEPLLETMQNEQEHPGVRGQAAEGIGMLLSGTDRRRKQFKQALHALIAALHDAAPEVRFWAAFALGSLRATEALPELRRLAESDDAMCPGWWLVKDEASDAVTQILGGHPPLRTRMSSTGSS